MEDFTGVMDSMSSGSESAGSPPAQESDASGAGASYAESSASETTTQAGSVATTDNQIRLNPTEGQAIPYPRFKEVNEERNSYKAALDKLQWAQAIPETAAPAIAQFYQELQRDPVGTLIRELEGIASSDPAHAQAWRSAAARALGMSRQQPAQESMPEPDLQAPDGTLVYSAQQAQRLLDWRDKRAEQRMAQQIQPLQQWAARAQAEQMRAEITNTANQWAQKTYAQWSQRPHFVEHKKEIAALMQANPDYSIADAYADVLQQHVLPKLQHTVRSDVAASIHNRAAAGTMNPSRGPAQGAPKPKDFGDAMRQLMQGVG